MTKIIFISGSVRIGSYNAKLANLACKIAKNIDGVEAEYINLAEYEMPIYNEDVEKQFGLIDEAKKLQEKFVQADALFIASPEYNSSYSALLKNTIDWVSRDGGQGKEPLRAFKGKVVAISAASPGGLGGLRGLVPLRMLLENISMMVIPEQLAISSAFDAFDEEDNLKDEAQMLILTNIVNKLADTATRLNN